MFVTSYEEGKLQAEVPW